MAQSANKNGESRLDCHKRGTNEILQLSDEAVPLSLDDCQTPAMMMNVNRRHVGSRVPVVGVEICGREGRSIRTNAMLDGGSEITLCSKRLLQRLGLKTDGKKGSIEVVTLFHQDTMKGGCVDGLRVWNREYGGEEVHLHQTYIVESIPISKNKLATIHDIELWEHLGEVRVAELDEVELLIGQNVPAASEPLQVVSAPRKGEPYALLTSLGWIVCGLPSSGGGQIHLGKIGVRDLNEHIQRAFDIGFEDLGSCDKGFSVYDEKWKNIMETGIRDAAGRFEIPLPFKEDHGTIPFSRNVALRRAISLKKKLKRTPEQEDGYCRAIRDLVERGYAEVVPTQDIGKIDRVWYIPHFAVNHPMKPGKIRVVMDCAAKIGGVCLNDLLISGPDMGDDLVDVLSHFRLGSYAYPADIEAMFFQVLVPEEQRNYLRFLWWQDLNDWNSLTEFRMKVHPFGATSSPSVATYALRQSANRNAACSAEVRRVINSNFHVDDCLIAGDTERELKKEAVQVAEVGAGSGFKLTKYVGNLKIEEAMPLEQINEDTVVRILRIKWDRKNDVLTTELPGMLMPETRRLLLSLVASVFDPLGIVAPLVLKGRLLLQESFRHRRKSDWDAPLPESVTKKVKLWLIDLRASRVVSIQRGFHFLNDTASVQLHVFADASRQGHGAVAYLRLDYGSYIKCQFVWGKARVNPLKEVTIPRLELTAAVLATHIYMRVERIVDYSFESVTLWTDSMVVLRYLRNEKDRFGTFISNRLTTIEERTNIKDWRFIPSKENPADEASRAIHTERWTRGPDFLLKPEATWPTESIYADHEIEKLEVIEPRVRVNLMAADDRVVDVFVDRYSDWVKLKRAVSWWLLYKKKLRGLDRDKVNLTVSDLKEAEYELVKIEQRRFYLSEVEQLENGNNIHQKSSLRHLDVKLKGNLLCVGGRLQRAELTDEQMHPIILPCKSRIASIIIKHIHHRLGHIGTRTVLSDLREHYWLVKGHATVRRELNSCVPCRRAKRPTIQQKMASLHHDRVVPRGYPFAVTGLDCFGPFIVKIGRRREKRYGVIFTCLAMRAVHLEIAVDLSTDGILNAIRRFVARRGVVDKFISDNGTNFVGARKELLRSLSNRTIRDRLVNCGISWDFNPPGASHFGGAWEGLCVEYWT